MNDPVFLLGAGGFIGRHLARRLAVDGREVVAATRSAVAFDHPGIRNVVGNRDDHNSAARTAFGRSPRVALDDGLHRAWDWIRWQA